jgi:hypothetical protein
MDGGRSSTGSESIMSPLQVIVKGTLKPDGTLELDERPDLPSGRVQVALTVEGQPSLVKKDWWSVLERVAKEREASGMVGRSKEEIDADVRTLRDELDARLDEIDRIREEIRRDKDGPDC